MTVKIVLSKVVVRGEPMFKLKSVKGCLQREQLPAQYCQGNNFFYLQPPEVAGEEATLLVHSMRYSPGATYLCAYKIGAIISHEDKLWMEDAVKAGGQELSKINKELKKLKAEWEGIESTYVF